MAAYTPGVYLKFDEMEALMKAWAEQYPAVASLESIGTTHGSETTGPGKELWLLTLTDAATGAHDSKPAFWCDGNTHAGEVTGMQACLHLAHTLLTGWEAEEPRARTLLATSTVYVLPRISADGAELYLTTPHTCRSSPMFFPEPEPSPGLQPKDMTGDGELLLMRIPHSAGSFKASSKDARLMLPRAPDDDLLLDDDDTTYYRLLPEGEFLEYDGFEQTIGSRWGLDANRHFPHAYRPEGTQNGAGPHPMFLEEIDAVVKAITARNNICTIQSYHTYAAVVLRPPINGTDNDMAQDDLASFKALDLRAEATTGYPAVGIGAGFKYNPNIDIGGGSNDWMYSDRGILACECCNGLRLGCGVCLTPVAAVRLHRDLASLQGVRGVWRGPNEAALRPRPYRLPEGDEGGRARHCAQVVRRAPAGELHMPPPLHLSPGSDTFTGHRRGATLQTGPPSSTRSSARSRSAAGGTSSSGRIRRRCSSRRSWPRTPTSR